jgi:hypothetical protein
VKAKTMNTLRCARCYKTEKLPIFKILHTNILRFFPPNTLNSGAVVMDIIILKKETRSQIEQAMKPTHYLIDGSI